MKIGDIYSTHCYKHDGTLNKVIKTSQLIEKTENILIFGNNKTEVVRESGKIWKTKDKAIIFFIKDKWYNVVVQFKKEKIFYYCNIICPYIIEENAIKYIDYDLDLRVFANKKFKILDRDEFNDHKIKMNYSNNLVRIINENLSEIIIKYKENNILFNDENNKRLLREYEKIIKETKNVK